MKDESPAILAEAAFEEQHETDVSGPLRLPDRPHRPRRHFKKKFRKLHSENRDKPVARGARFDLTPPPSQPPQFCSRSEAICAELLRRFIANFELREGLTFQVPIGSDGRGNTYSVDFLVDGVLLEYHPVRFYRNKKGFGDFRDSDEYRSYTRPCTPSRESRDDSFTKRWRLGSRRTTSAGAGRCSTSTLSSAAWS